MNHRSIASFVVAGWTLALVTGCASLPSVGPDYKGIELDVTESPLLDAGEPTKDLDPMLGYKPAAADKDRRIDLSQNMDDRWWTRFNDSILDRLVEGGISNNVGYLMAQKRLEQAQYELFGSYAAFLPKFGLDGAWSRYWYHRNTLSGSSRPNGTHYNAQTAALDGNWEIDIFGGSRRATEAAFAQAEAAGWSVADAFVSLTAQIVQNYVNLRTTQERIDVARTNLVLQSETYDILKSRLDSGIGDELAVNQCAYIVEQTRARIPQLLAREEQLKNTLAVLAGEFPGAFEDYLKPLANRRDWLLAPQKVAELKLDMLRARPDVRCAEMNLAAQVARIGVAEAQWFPKLYLSGTVGFQSKNGTRLFERSSFLASLGPSISWPIFQGGAIWANVKATEAKVDELALAYSQTVQDAYGEVRNAYTCYSQEYHRYQALESAVKAASDAVIISQDLYKNGLKDFNNVLDAQRSRLTIEEEFTISRGQITLYLIELYRSLGGGLATRK